MGETKTAEHVGIINDEFFTHPDTIVTFRSLIPHDATYMAIIDGSNQTLTRTISLVPFHNKVWTHDDVAKNSRPTVKATVLCGTRTLLKDLVLDQVSPYIYLQDIEEKTGELLLGGRVTFYMIKEYRRFADDSIFRERLGALYDLTLTEERVAISDVAVCTKEWTITSQWQRKTRHRRTHYTAQDVYRITTKYPHPGIGAFVIPPAEEMSRVRVKTVLKFKSHEAESPECGNNGGNLPLGAVIE